MSIMIVNSTMSKKFLIIIAMIIFIFIITIIMRFLIIRVVF